MRKRFTMLFAFMAAITVCNAQRNSIIASWNFYSQVNGGTDNLLPSELNDGVTATGLSKRQGLKTDVSKLPHYWGAKGSSLDQTGPQDAISGGKFFSCSFTPKDGKSVSFNATKPVKIRVFSVGPINFLLQYSVDGATYKDISTATIERPKAFSDFVLPAYEMSAVKELQNVRAGTTVSFRIVPWGAKSEGYNHFYLGSAYDVPSLTFMGSVK